MTVFKSTDGIVVGQPISPFFGAQNGIQGAGAPVIQSPATSAASGPQISTLEQVGKGAMPGNALVNTVNGVNVGGTVTPPNIGADPCSVIELLASGNGNQANGGVGQPIIPGQPSENQQYTVTLSAVAMTENGPTPVNVDTLGVAPVPAGTPVNQIGLVASGFIG
jgi:hypothetical protein